MRDDLGDRMKDFYEDRTRYKLARRTNTIIRIDGKAFHTYTKGLKRPFDEGLIEDMNNTTKYLCQNIQGSKFGYVQSDEISILITDYDSINTHAWFDGNLQKMASIAASLATSEFNRLRLKRYVKDKFDLGITNITPLWMDGISNLKPANFDARVFQIPSQEEVINYFIWRQQDATRNSISSVAQSLYSPKELHGVKTVEMQELIFKKDINWNDYTPREKQGAIIRKFPVVMQNEDVTYTRSKWMADENTPVFTQNKGYLRFLMPHSIDDKTAIL